MGIERLMESLPAFPRFLQNRRMTPQQYQFLRLSQAAWTPGTDASELAIVCKCLEKAGLLARTRGQKDGCVGQKRGQIDTLRQRRCEIPEACLHMLARCERAGRLAEQLRETANVQNPGEVNTHGSGH